MPKTTKVSHVNPIQREQNISTSQSTGDCVYNHLNETATIDRDDFYDHARPPSSTSTHCEGYGTLVFNNEEKDVYVEGDDNKGAGSNVGKGNENEHTVHNYFVLEKETR
ncbi:uncharacterized protein LOC133187658 [Saccostrea echinata]|uniref:uncharacterized protein LOC133187658 n=1 Tax=Saccostrea echinata TaxID=191078 RepID=UPI002A7F9D93|nr:uncharacterized protein LOC133187658 [Saccostrea echinata]